MQKWQWAAFGTDKSRSLLVLFEQVNVSSLPNCRYFVYQTGQQREPHKNEFYQNCEYEYYQGSELEIMMKLIGSLVWFLCILLELWSLKCQKWPICSRFYVVLWCNLIKINQLNLQKRSSESHPLFYIRKFL